MEELDKESAAPVSAFSDAIAKILRHPGGPRPRKIKREKPEFPGEMPGAEIEESKPDVISNKDSPAESSTLKKKVLKKRKKEVREPWHLIPEVTERDRERKLNKTATRGVVQLFNAVRQQQNAIQEQLEEAGPSVRKSDKVLKSVSKGAFFDLLKGTNPRPDGSSAPDIHNKNSTGKRWEVLDDQYMVKSGVNVDSDGNESERSSEDDAEEMQEIF